MRVFVEKSRETLFFPGFLSMGIERAGGKIELVSKKFPVLFSILAEQKSFLYIICDT